jgi:NAD(P)-dependent dehydrogenase (short-subunit alcohol dehydrogenase family)
MNGPVTQRFSGRKAIVTGAGFGIGRAIALRLAVEGCDIGIFDRSAGDAQETARLVREAGRRAEIATGDVSDRADVQAGMDGLVAALGAVEILVNNAGILRTGPFLETTPETWRAVLAVNLDGVFHCCQAILPHMIARQSGAIVNMSSWTGKKGVPNHAAYATSKFGVIGLTQSIAGEVSPMGIRVNAVCPGMIGNTAMRNQADALSREQGLPDITSRLQTVPMRRIGTPEDVAAVVAFLASDDAGYMTGQAVNITGGLWMN